MITTSILNYGTNSHPTTAEEANRFLTNFVTPGIVGAFTNTAGVAPMTGSFGVNANTGSDKNIVIAVGDAVVTATPTGQASQNLQIRNTSSITKLLSDNISGSTQYDWVYVATDATKANNPLVDSSDVTAVTVVRGTSATVPPAGAPAYFVLAAVITLLTGYTAVTNGMIADKRTTAGAAVPNGSINTTKIGWPTFALNMKSVSNAGLITPINGDQDLASSGLSLSFTVASPCNAMVTVSLGVASAGDFEFRPEVRLGGTLLQTFSPSAQGVVATRASVRTFTTTIALATGVNIISAGVFLGSGSGYSIATGGAYLSALVLGNVTA